MSLFVCLSERAAELQQTVEELQKALDMMKQARDEDQRASQQEVDERDKLIQSLSSENQRLHQLLQVRVSQSGGKEDRGG